LAVKRSQSASRVLATFEAIAAQQPIGVSALARVLDADKSAVQRAIMTLADEGWIRAAAGTPTRWELTAHIHAVARMDYASNGLRQRSRSALEALRDASGESVLLTVPDVRSFVVVDAVESRQMLRTAPRIGMLVPARDTATARALLPFMSPDQQFALLGEAPDGAMVGGFAATIARGYSVSAGDITLGSTNIGAAIIEADGRAVGAVIISAPTDRLPADQHPRIGEMVAQTARTLSRGAPRFAPQ
jgi:DNA-binding IclR family transcriptional regulator